MRRGISLASVVIATFLLILLMTTVTISVNKLSENSKKLIFAAELNSLQTTISSYVIANGDYPITDENILVDVSEVKESFLEEDIENNTVILSKIDYDKIGYMSLNYGTGETEGDEYAVSTLTGKVYYAGGLSIGNTTYYTLTDELKKLLSSGKSSISSENIVVFMVNETGWTNEEVEVSVKVPKTYTNISVTTLNTSYSLSSEDENYYIYDVKEKGNYEINVVYLDNNSSGSASYSVKNYDDVKPIIEVDRHVTLNEEYGSDIYGYFTVTNVDDADSGVKEIKYEYGKIEDDVSTYFKTNGQVVEDNKIMIKRGYEYVTVYAVDNASNYTLEYLKI